MEKCCENGCTINCEDTTVATIECNKDGFTIKCTPEGKQICKTKGKGCCG